LFEKIPKFAFIANKFIEWMEVFASFYTPIEIFIGEQLKLIDKTFRIKIL